MRHIIILFFSLIIALSALRGAAQTTSTLRVNQVGYYPAGHKSATIEQDGIGATVTLTSLDSGEEVWSDEFDNLIESPLSGKLRTVVDFSSVRAEGAYLLTNGSDEQLIIIKEHALAALATAALKAFYLQRSGETISEEYAGVYARPLGHADTRVVVHASAASAARPAGTVISSPRGWYDAGDYNKYSVNAAFSLALLLDAYERDASYFATLDTNIPESDNAIPDILDEALVTLRWLQTMQDSDGGVYHKLTSPTFEGFIMPCACQQERYVVAKSTAATLDFAAVLAMAARIYRAFPAYAAWAAAALTQAQQAYAWAQKHPDIYYDQSALNAIYSPAISTGEYGDSDVDDEFLWAATELYRATHDEAYAAAVAHAAQQPFAPPTWDKVAGLATYALLLEGGSEEHLAPALTAYLAPYLASLAGAAFDSPYGNRADDFCWGGTAERGAGLGIALLYAYHLTADNTYLDAALRTMDYLLGRNATGYCYVTGFGSCSPQQPHHRLSAADGIAAPLPGFLVGGPNPSKQDQSATLVYPSSAPDEAYIDSVASYASNEIAINWNASLVALAAGIDAAMGKQTATEE